MIPYFTQNSCGDTITLNTSDEIQPYSFSVSFVFGREPETLTFFR